MLAFLARRLMSMALVMLLVAGMVFVIVRVVPGDPAAVMLGDTATPDDVAKLRASLGLDRSLLVQFTIYMRDIASGNLGRSIFLDEPVLQSIFERASLTSLLTGMAIVIAIAIGIPVGVIAAVRTGSALDQILTTTATLAGGLPSFWIGLSLIQFFSLTLGWMPVAGYGPPDAGFFQRLYFLILPAFALGIPSSALIMRFTRSSMLDVLGEDYIRTARAKGIGVTRVALKHALRNAAVPILAIVGLTVSILIGGAIVTETVFALPGIGNLVVQGVLHRDYPVIQGALLVISGIFVLINIVTDILYALLDPRIRY